MDILSKPILITFLILIIVSGYTIYNINQFKPTLEKCSSGFEIIDNCGCFPDKNLKNLFYRPTLDQIPLNEIEYK